MPTKKAKNSWQKNSPFDSICFHDDEGKEYWSSRELAKVLEYEDFRNFLSVLEKAKIACNNSDFNIDDHFVDVTEMIALAKGAQREVTTTLLSRYACYLIVQNADPRKEIIAHGQTYFAIQTRRQELAQLSPEEIQRLSLRQKLRQHNSHLADAANNAGIKSPKDYAIFQNYGYMGLYGGLKQADIHARKGLKKSQKILNHMGSTELAANLFRATQAEEKLRRDGIQGKQAANHVHKAVGEKVRQTIQELGGTMPEDLPSVESIKKLESKRNALTTSCQSQKTLSSK